MIHVAEVQRLIAQARGDDAEALLLAAAALLTEAVALLAAKRASPAPADPELFNLTVREAAALTGMSARWLYEHAPELPYARKRGRCWRFSKAGIERSTRK